MKITNLILIILPSVFVSVAAHAADEPDMTAHLTFPDGATADISSVEARFNVLEVAIPDMIQVDLSAPGLARQTVALVSMDGGTVDVDPLLVDEPSEVTLNANGAGTFHFAPGSDSGFYRILMTVDGVPVSVMTIKLSPAS